ncbi:MAG TPA: hypothetical protein VN726_16435 [Hanamia sp.]|nr:hypothetical protein [Hanamia sp.]
MTPNTKVQFILFDTILPAEPFMKRWKEYTRSSNSDADVTLQQSSHHGGFRYIAQHRFAREEVQFVFAKEKRSSRIPQESIRSQMAGGYAISQAGRLSDTGPGERKVFAFITDPATDLTIFKDLSRQGQLNIYEPYYENCKYCFILEYFVKRKPAGGLVEQLKNLEIMDAAVYQECKIPKSLNMTQNEKAFYVWPSV